MLKYYNGLAGAVWRCAGVLVVGALIGWISGRFTGIMLLTLSGCLIWLLVRIRQLEHWVARSRRIGLANQQEMIGVWTNITGDIQMMLARHEKERLRLQAVVHRVQEMTTALTDAVILVDRRGNMEWWNKAAAELFSFRDIDLGQKLSNLIRHPRFVEYYDRKQYGAPLELTMWRKDQHLEFQIHLFGDEERLVIARDITRLFKLEQMRKDFVANVSHELRTPLTVVLGYLETIADSPQLPAAWQKIVQQMQQQAQRMTLLINDLITLAKLETDQKDPQGKPVALAPMIDGIVSDAKSLSGDKHHQFVVQGDPNVQLLGNERELRSALSNLVVNAVNYSPPHSRIEIRFEERAKEVVVQVRDQGIGIDPKHIPRITERFYRVDPSRSVASGGTGLGLAIVKHVLLRHNGELTITSQFGKGSEFTCHFPNRLPSLNSGSH